MAKVYVKATLHFTPQELERLGIEPDAQDFQTWERASERLEDWVAAHPEEAFDHLDELRSQDIEADLDAA